MSRTLNQEVSVFNFNGPIRDVKDAFARDMITENTETSTTASKAYTAGETFIWTDRKVYKAKSAIASGETLSSAANGNIKAVGSIADEVVKTSDGFNEYVNELGVKNLIPYPYSHESGTEKNGIKFTINDDYSVTAKGTFSTTSTSFQLLSRLDKENSKKMVDYARKGAIVSGGLGSTDAVTFEWYNSELQYISSSPIGTKGKLNVPESAVYCNISLYITKGSRTSIDETFYPMFRLASDTDDTYVPYAKTNQQLAKETTGLIDNVNKNGCKNLLNNEAKTTTQADGSNTIKYTVYEDGRINVTGERSSWKILSVSRKENNFLPIGKYILSGSSSSISLRLYDLTSASELALSQNGEEVGFEITQDMLEHDIILQCYITNTNVSVNSSVYPMIRLASDTDNTYAPYAKSNKELTDDLRSLSKGWQNITGITGSANEIVTFTDLIGATTLLIDCEYKNAGGGHYTTTNLVHANGASDLIALRAVDVANFYESCRSITWDSATGTLTLKSLGRNRLIDGTISEDKLFCYPLRIKPIY